MSSRRIALSPGYSKRLSEIEDFVFESAGRDIVAVEKFLDEHDLALNFIKENRKTPAPHPQTGDQSWPFSDGRYRLFL